MSRYYCFTGPDGREWLARYPCVRSQPAAQRRAMLAAWLDDRRRDGCRDIRRVSESVWRRVAGDRG